MSENENRITSVQVGFFSTTLTCTKNIVQSKEAALGFKEEKRKVIECLNQGYVLHEERGDINVKNFLATGKVSLNDVASIIVNLEVILIPVVRITMIEKLKCM